MQNKVTDQDLKPFQPFGIPLLKLMAGFILVSLTITALYEILF